MIFKETLRLDYYEKKFLRNRSFNVKAYATLEAGSKWYGHVLISEHRGSHAVTMMTQGFEAEGKAEITMLLEASVNSFFQGVEENANSQL